MGGLYVPVNLYRLVAQIVLSPKSPDWFLALMQSITRKAGLSAEVVHSDFDRKPFA